MESGQLPLCNWISGKSMPLPGHIYSFLVILPIYIGSQIPLLVALSINNLVVSLYVWRGL